MRRRSKEEKPAEGLRRRIWKAVMTFAVEMSHEAAGAEAVWFIIYRCSAVQCSAVSGAPDRVVRR